MGKAPAFQFYVRDWLTDPELRRACAASRGIWADCLAYMWEARTRGQLTIDCSQVARFLCCTEDEALTFLDEAKRYKFADVTFSNNEVTITNRRMYREHIQRENTRLRVKKHRSNTPCNADVTPPSSSSSSTAKKTTAKKPQRVSAFSLPEWMPETTWLLFLDHRKKVKAPVSEKAYPSFVKKFESLKDGGWPPERIVDLMVEKGWRWFKPEWIEKDGIFPKGQKTQEDKQADEERRKIAEERRHREEHPEEYVDGGQVAEITKKFGMDFGNRGGEAA